LKVQRNDLATMAVRGGARLDARIADPSDRDSTSLESRDP
jgi:hypothetical protein